MASARLAKHPSMAPTVGTGDFDAALERAYRDLVKVSVDYAIMEKADNIVMARGTFPWDDVGSWTALADHFDVSYELEHQISGSSKEGLLADIRTILDECTFSYTRQSEMKGLGHAILTGETLVGNEPFGVVLADDLCVGEGEGVLTQMARIYNKYRCSVVAIEEVPHDEVEKYGVIAGSELEDGVYVISKMVEKPKPDDAPSNLAIIGRYILTPDIFDVIRNTPPGRNGEIQITDALQIQAERNMVLAYRFKGRRFDCGSVHGFVEATNYFYERWKETQD